MVKVLKSVYEEPKLDITAFADSDIIITSSTAGEVGSDGNVDNEGGWTNGSANW